MDITFLFHVKISGALGEKIGGAKIEIPSKNDPCFVA